MTLQCLNPYRDKVTDATGGCRKCANCMKLRALQWRSRICYEMAFNENRPLFLTFTTAKVGTIDDYKKFVQNFRRRLRKRGITIRDFIVLEKGLKKGRLHGHGICWINAGEISNADLYSLLQASWREGICFYKYLYGGTSGVNYAIKYLFKSPLWYSSSRRPFLGTEGRNQYVEYAISRYLDDRIIPRSMRIPILGDLKPIHVPINWEKRVREILGLKWSHEDEKYYLSDKRFYTDIDNIEGLRQWHEEKTE